MDRRPVKALPRTWAGNPEQLTTLHADPVGDHALVMAWLDKLVRAGFWFVFEPLPNGHIELTIQAADVALAEKLTSPPAPAPRRIASPQ